METGKRNGVRSAENAEKVLKIPENLEAFYEEVFGQPRLVKKDGEWLIKPHDAGPFRKIAGDKEVSETVLNPAQTTSGAGAYLGYIAVGDFEAAKEKLDEFNCVRLTRLDDEYHKQLNIRAAFYYDPAGNLFNLIEESQD